MSIYFTAICTLFHVAKSLSSGSDIFLGKKLIFKNFIFKKKSFGKYWSWKYISVKYYLLVWKIEKCLFWKKNRSHFQETKKTFLVLKSVFYFHENHNISIEQIGPSLLQCACPDMYFIRIKNCMIGTTKCKTNCVLFDFPKDE